jgi:hypothetical protein
MEKKELLDTLEELFADAYVCDRHCEHVLDQREVLKRIKAAQHSAHPTKATPRFADVIVNKIVGLFSRLRG